MMQQFGRFLAFGVLLFFAAFFTLYMAMSLAVNEMTEGVYKTLMGSEGAFVEGDGPFLFPVADEYVITSGFGERDLGLAGASTYHEGIDISTLDGETTPVFAAGNGIVLSAGYNSRAGNYVILDHGEGISTVYMHMADESFFVKEGEYISKGQVLGLMGNTGVSSGLHLHFEIRISGTSVNPAAFFSQNKGEEDHGDE